MSAPATYCLALRQRREWRGIDIVRVGRVGFTQVTWP
jgi:hypothetical protein